jgi:hypothetical protein
MADRYRVDCWNCDEGFVNDEDNELDDERCALCEGKGFLIVTQLTDDNCENAERIA